MFGVQISMFDGTQRKIIRKPIRLIECFAGYGSQSLALKYLGANYESWKICEWAVRSIQAYKDLHHAEDKTDYSAPYDFEYIQQYLLERGISLDYSNPATKEQIKRLGEKQCRTIYNNIIATHNLVSVCNAKGKDLEIVDTDKYEYILTYSFPCQDLSKAGTMSGMEKGSGTRSGLLWEIERMLLELRDSNSPLPQVLLMENVPDVIGERNRAHFNDWLNQLESLGYHNYYKIMNAKHYGIPQNRERCFMFSILGDYYVDMPPKKLKLKYKLRDLLERKVDKSFFLSEDKIKSIANWKAQQDPLKNIDKEKEIAPTLTARGAGEEHSGMILINEDTIPIKNATQKGYLEAKEGDGVDISSRMQYHRGTVQKGMAQTLTTAGGENVGVVVGTFNYAKSDNFMQGKDRFKKGKDIADCVLTEPKEGIAIQELSLKAQMCNKLIEEGKVQEYDVIRHSYTTSRMNGEMKDIQQNDISPTLDTRCDCLGVVVSEGPKDDYSKEEPQVLAGLGEKKSNDGTQWYQQDRIYDDKVAISVTTSFNPYYATPSEDTYVAAAQRGREDGQQLEISNREVANALTTVQKDSMIAQVTKIGNYSPSGHNAASIVDANGCAPTVMENHGTVTATKVGLHIRKLTPRESFRLQGVANEDIDKMSHYTNGNAWHLAGDSICTVCLQALFGELLDLDYTTLIEKFIEENIIEKNVIE